MCGGSSCFVVVFCAVVWDFPDPAELFAEIQPMCAKDEKILSFEYLICIYHKVWGAAGHVGQRRKGKTHHVAAAEGGDACLGTGAA